MLWILELVGGVGLLLLGIMLVLGILTCIGILGLGLIYKFAEIVENKLK